MKTNLFLIILLAMLVGTIIGAVLMAISINGFTKGFYIVVMLLAATIMGFVGDTLNKRLRKDIDKYVTEGEYESKCN